MYFPALAAAENSVPQMLPSHQEPKETGTILLVEDEPAVRMVTREMLLQQGYIVLEADGAEAARRLCRDRASIDLLFTDVIMPETNGSVLARELREEWPRLKVLFMSGYTTTLLRSMAYANPSSILSRSHSPRNVFRPKSAMFFARALAPKVPYCKA